MLRDITIGQYYKSDSFVHSLDPRTKLISLVVMMVAIFIASSPVEYAVVTVVTVVCILASRVPVSFILKGMKPIWLIIAFTAGVNLLMGGGENILAQWWIFTITEESVRLAASMALRVVLLVGISSLLTLTTSPMALTTGIEKLLKPFEKIKLPAHEIAMMMSIALRFIPTLTEEAEKIMKAQASRGNDFESGNLFQKAKGMIPLFVPLFVSAFRRADELAMAMECRCYNGGANRTSFRQLKYKKCDITAFVFMAIVVFGIVVCRIWGV